MKVKTGVASVVALVAVAAAYAAPSARADCVDSQYWNIASQYHSPGEGHSCLQYGPDSAEAVLSTFGGGYSTIRAFTSFAGGKWTDSALISYNTEFVFFDANDKVGVQNNHPDTIWVNSRHYDF